MAKETVGSQGHGVQQEGVSRYHGDVYSPYSISTLQPINLLQQLLNPSPVEGGLDPGMDQSLAWLHFVNPDSA